MTAATKVTIAVAVLFAAVLGIYYGFSGPRGRGVSPPPETAADVPAQAQAPPVPSAPQQDKAAMLPPPEGGNVLASDLSRAAGSPVGAAPGPGVAAPAPPREEVWVVRAPSLADPLTAPAPASAQSFSDYYVHEGDSLWTIAEIQLGDPMRWRWIADANPGINPDRLQTGARLRLPLGPPGRLNLNHAAAVEPQPGALPPAGTSLHVVASGDSLSSIAGRYYGDPARWRPIYDANRVIIGSDPDRLKVGMRLNVPQAKTPA